RKLSVGYDPTTTPNVVFPKLTTAGSTTSKYVGDLWQAARVTWTGDANNPCLIEPVPSRAVKTDKEGLNNVCVDTNAQNDPSATAAGAMWLFTPGGGYPRGAWPISSPTSGGDAGVVDAASSVDATTGDADMGDGASSSSDAATANGTPIGNLCWH